MYQNEHKMFDDKNTFWLAKTQKKTSIQNIGGEVIVQDNKILKHTRKHTGIQAKLYQKLLYESPACNFQFNAFNSKLLCFSVARNRVANSSFLFSFTNLAFTVATTVLIATFSFICLGP